MAASTRLIATAAALTIGGACLAEPRFHVVSSVLETQRSSAEIDAVVTHSARFYLGDRQSGALVLCAGAVSLSRNENILDSRLECWPMPAGDRPLGGAVTHHGLGMEAIEPQRGSVDAVLTLAEAPPTARVCIRLSLPPLACVAAEIPVPASAGP